MLERIGHRENILLLLLCLVLVAVLYGGSLFLPLYMDDIILVKSVSRTSLAGIFYEPNVESYYRPVRLLPIKLVEIISGEYNAVILHGINLLFHVVVAFLSGKVARVLFPEQKALPYLTAIIFLIFPFNYQVIPWVSALTHLLTATGCLLAMLYTERWWHSSSYLDWLMVCAGVAIAVFSHENGVAVVYLIGLMFVLRRERLNEWRRILVFISPIVGIVLIFIAIWVLIPKARDDASVTFTDISQNFLYFSQGFSFPLSQFEGIISRFVDVPAMVIAGFAAVLSLIIVIAIARRDSIAGILWYGGIVCIPALFLTHSYVYDGPRLMLLASIGAALVWGMVLIHLWEWQRWLAVIVAIFITGSGALFVYERMRLHYELDGLYDDMFRLVEQNGDGVYVNLPAWLTYQDSRFPMGSEGVTYMTQYFGLRDFVSVNTGLEQELFGFIVADLRPDLEHYWWGIDFPDEPKEIVRDYIHQYGSGAVFAVAGNQWVWDSARLLEDSPDDADYVFENGVSLIRAEAIYTGDGLVASQLMWGVDGDEASTAQPFVHLACTDNPLVSQLDGMPLHGLLDFGSWESGEIWQEIRHLPGAPASNSGCYVRVGLFDPVEGVRIPIVGSDEDMIRIEIDYSTRTISR